MYIKEVLEARGKFALFTLLVAASAIGNMLIVLLMPNNHTPFEVSSWDNWFHTNAIGLLAIFAAILGTSLISGEVSRGSIFFLLSKPVSRERVLLTKYATSALLILLVALIGALLVYIIGSTAGHSLVLANILMSVALAWTGTLFVLGLTLVFSVLLHDSVRPALIALSITAMLALPLLLPGGHSLSLISSWFNADTYFRGTFPFTGLLVNLVAAIVPLLIALLLFRKKAY